MSTQLTAVLVPAFIPSPSQGVWEIGPLPLRGYALCILLGIYLGYLLGKRRWVARGGKPEVAGDMVMWAVPFGLIGARIYHVITDYQLYFGEGRNPVDALKIWNGGLGVWGAVAFGALGAWIACRRHGVPFLVMADAFAPGIVLAQAVGRWGNWFNQELFGGPTTQPWALEIDLAHRPEGYEQFATFHPTFLYEFLWNLGVVALVILVDRRYKLGHGRAFALYVAGYTLGRGWIEYMRIDSVNHVFGLRLNVWTSIILFIAAVAYFVISQRLRPGQEDLRALETPEPTDGEPTAEASDEPSAAEPPAAEPPADEPPADEVPADEPAKAEAAGDHEEPADDVPVKAKEDVAPVEEDVPAEAADDVPVKAKEDVPAVEDEVPAEAADDVAVKAKEDVAPVEDDVPVKAEDDQQADGDGDVKAPGDGARA